MSNIVFFVPLALVVLAGFVVLQIILSKRDNIWLGLMLPIIWFCIALAGSGYQVYEWSLDNTTTNSLGWVGAAVAFFFAYNVPTVVLLVIYFVCRGKRRRKQALDKMNVQDL
jgi:Na+-driven multidrug efflux pump